MKHAFTLGRSTAAEHKQAASAAESQPHAVVQVRGGQLHGAGRPDVQVQSRAQRQLRRLELDLDCVATVPERQQPAPKADVAGEQA